MSPYAVTPQKNEESEDGGRRPLGRSAPRALPPSVPPADPAAPYETGTMPVELLVLQPGREHLPVLHSYPQGYTTWFNKSKNGISSIHERINQMVEQAVPKKKGRLVGLVRRASSCTPSSQAPFSPPDPMIIEQLQNKDDRIVALET
ncbi:hypothetical protein F2Q68_00041251 [Brassica cretica]|uniref:Uncharacterized protein n=1 Tax=Brassica cretica TaxID=69181 RepID=A0A8S9MK70_BRACR|nr:hypothetical protein F2Q68_00041251 [Brassica cretica]